MSKYFKVKKLKEEEILINLVQANKRKPGDILKVVYVSRANSNIDLMIGYDFNRNDFSECRQSKLVRETRQATVAEIELFKKGKININD